jgi:hypothetical protein
MQVRTATKRGGGSSKNGRDSAGKRLGVKKYTGGSLSLLYTGVCLSSCPSCDRERSVSTNEDQTGEVEDRRIFLIESWPEDEDEGKEEESDDHDPNQTGSNQRTPLTFRPIHPPRPNNNPTKRLNIPSRPTRPYGHRPNSIRHGTGIR